MKSIYYILLFALAFTLSNARSMAAERPNIVVILTDDQGYADISLNPHHAAEVSTPNMDALAQEGVVFSQGYTSGPVCSPTRAGIMIGGFPRLFPERVGIGAHSQAAGRWTRTRDNWRLTIQCSDTAIVVLVCGSSPKVKTDSDSNPLLAL